MNQKHNEMVGELIATHFPTSVYANMTDRQKECVRSCVNAALVSGGIQAISGGENNHLIRVMADDAREFEKTLNHASNTTRVPSSVYPWGWHYEDESVQKKFRAYCQRNKAEA